MILIPIAALLLLNPQQPTLAVGTGPDPAPTPISWELEFKFLDPRRIEVQLPGESTARTYWYMVYTITNPGDRTQRFFPTFQLVTEDLRVIDSDVGIHPFVFEAIRERHKTTHKYLVSPTKAIGDLLAGDDNARESVAIWREVDLNVNQFTVYVAGLSGEARFVPNPAYNPGRAAAVQVTGPAGRPQEVPANPKHFTLRKTFEIRYTLPGSPQTRMLRTPQRGPGQWVMR